MHVKIIIVIIYDIGVQNFKIKIITQKIKYRG